MNNMRFRQVHLDFHTSEHIQNIGGNFDAEEFASILKQANVNSVTCFSKCHHGWSYHKTKVGKPHPHLQCELLPLQIESCHKQDIKVPVYISVGFDELAARENSQWCIIEPDGKVVPPLEARWKRLCLNTEYLDYVIEQTREVINNYEADGLFFDIILPWQCCCNKCLSSMHKKGLNPESSEDRSKFVNSTLHNYYSKMNQAIYAIKSDMPIFHNSGHVYPEFVKYQSHLELESLPTGGWGYDHFPMSARYSSQLGYQFLGMTGKFHTTWGEFGGFKHPNALKYECSAMLAYGAKCSIGDQLDPTGKLDEGTYNLIGQAYNEVRVKENYCDNVETVAEIGLLASNLNDRKKQSDVGASRILLEGHFLFDVINERMDFSKYKLLILPDDCVIDNDKKTKIDAYLHTGGKILLTGQSGFDKDDQFFFDVGAKFFCTSQYMPDFILPEKEYCPDFISSPMVMYMRSRRIQVTNGRSLGKVYDPYFNRSYKHFCSHQHAPARKEPSDYNCGVIKDKICYIAHPVFSIYSAFGTVALKDYVIKVIKDLLGGTTINTNLPSTARVSLMNKPSENRYILHLLYANTIKRGGQMNVESGSITGRAGNIEVIEDLNSLHDIEVKLLLAGKVKSVVLQPQGQKIDYETKDKAIKFKLNNLLCHQMFEISLT